MVNERCRMEEMPNGVKLQLVCYSWYLPVTYQLSTQIYGFSEPISVSWGYRNVEYKKEWRIGKRTPK